MGMTVVFPVTGEFISFGFESRFLKEQNIFVHLILILSLNNIEQVNNVFFFIKSVLKARSIV